MKAILNKHATEEQKETILQHNPKAASLLDSQSNPTHKRLENFVPGEFAGEPIEKKLKAKLDLYQEKKSVKKHIYDQ